MNNYNLTVVIVNYLTKMVYYKLVKCIIDIVNHAKVIIDIVVRYHSLLKLIISDKSLLFISKNSGFCYAISLVLINNFLPLFIFKQIARLRDKI